MNCLCLHSNVLCKALSVFSDDDFDKDPRERDEENGSPIIDILVSIKACFVRLHATDTQTAMNYFQDSRNTVMFLLMSWVECPRILVMYLFIFSNQSLFLPLLQLIAEQTNQVRVIRSLHVSISTEL